MNQVTKVKGVTRDWDAELIAPLSDQGVGKPALFISQTFQVEDGAGACLYISALGLYRAFINGQRVGQDELTPGWTNYDDRIAYQRYDVSDLLQPGENRIEIWIGDGWYRGQMLTDWLANWNVWGDRVAVIAEIRNKSGVIVKTDASWKSGSTPITSNGIYYGEDYDARLEQLTATHGVEVLDKSAHCFVAHECAPARVFDAIAPIREWEDDKGHLLYDFGQNLAGFCEIEVEGEAGAVVYLDHSEVLGPKGEFDRRNYRDARTGLKYTLKGEGVERYRPMFTFMGYRYGRIQITGQAKIKSIKSLPVTSVPDIQGGFTCGNQLVNRLVMNTIWSQRSNFIEVPTDCPQRAERQGWTGDVQIFSGTSCWLADSDDFLRKFMNDVRSDQRADGAIAHFSPDPTRRHLEKYTTGSRSGSVCWGDVIVLTPWQLYLHYGDKDVLAENFQSMLDWLDFVWNISNGPIVYTSGKRPDPTFSFGDWLQPVGDNRKPRPTISDECVATIYSYISHSLAARIAGIIGNTHQETRLTARAAEIKEAFVAEFFSATGRLAHNDQTSYALAFYYDLVPAEHHEKAKGYFRRIIEDADYKIGTGFVGTPVLLPALSKIGMNDLAEKLLLNREVPGWLYQIEMGATTIWERWDAMAPDGTIYDPFMNSYNHYAYGAVCQWLFENVAGVRPDAMGAGFDKVIIEPSILPELEHVTMWHNCRHGRIDASWRIDGDAATYTVSLPVGCESILSASVGGGRVSLNGTETQIPPDGLPLPAGENVIRFALS